MKDLHRTLGRIAVWAALGLAVLITLSIFRPDIGTWEKQYGGGAIVSPPLVKGAVLGQSFSLEDANLDQVGLIYATYLKQARGKVELLILEGGRTPSSQDEIAERTLLKTEFEAGVLQDNQWHKQFLAKPLYDLGLSRSLYLLVRRDGEGADSPVSIYLDNYLACPYPKAQILRAGPDGSLKTETLKGHFSLHIGFKSKHSLLSVLLHRDWGLIYLLVGLLATLLMAVGYRPAEGGILAGKGRLPGGAVLIAAGLASGAAAGLISAFFKTEAHRYLVYEMYRSIGYLLKDDLTRWLAVFLAVAIVVALTLAGIRKILKDLDPGGLKNTVRILTFFLVAGLLVTGGRLLNELLLPPIFHRLSILINGVYLFFCLATGYLLTAGRVRKGFVAAGFKFAAAGLVGLTVILHLVVFGDGLFNKPKGPNIVFLAVDTLRADHMSGYGYFRNTTPNIDALAGEAICFKRAQANSSWTAPSFYSMLTAQYPAVLGFWGNFHPRVDDRFLCLAELFREAGYRTKGIIANTFLMADVGGIDQGFEEYDESCVYREPSSPRLTRLALDYIDDHKKEPFFLFVHWQDAHYPWFLQKDFDYYPEYKGRVKDGDSIGNLHGLIPTMKPEDIKRIKALYDSNIAYIDLHMGMIIDRLKELGLYDNTLIVLAADHGEEFLERNYFYPWLGHSRKLFQEYVHVPFIIKPPGPPRKVEVNQFVQLLDLMPTVAEYAGLELPQAYVRDGEILRVDKDGRVEDKPLIGETTSATHQQSVVWKGHKLIRYLRRHAELMFDLNEDPGETKNIVKTRPEIRARLEKALADWNKAVKESEVAKGGGVRLREEDIQRLRDLGYM